jgi:hypothetical protein
VRLGGLRLRGALHFVGEPGDVSQPVKDALTQISDCAQSIIDRVTPLVTTDPAPVVAAVLPHDANHVGGDRPAPSEEAIVRMLASIKSSLTRLDEQLAEAIDKLDPTQPLNPAVERLLALILHGAENIVADIAPYLADPTPEG